MKVCPKCGGEIEWGNIPCPDAKRYAEKGNHCLVIHKGWCCKNCGSVVDINKAPTQKTLGGKQR